MSEPQNEYETDAEPTPGPWRAVNLKSDYGDRYDYQIVRDCAEGGDSWNIASVHASAPSSVTDVPTETATCANANLIAAAGTAAQEAREMGYDPQKAVEELSDILRVLESISSIQKGHRHAGHTAAQTAQSKLDALKSAEGSEK